MSILIVHGIRVIRTNPEKPLDKNGVAIIQNSSVLSLSQFTICARIFTYQFDDFYSDYHTVMSIPMIYAEQRISHQFLASFSTRNLTTLKGYKEWMGKDWKFGKVYGTMFANNRQHFYNIWNLTKWQSVCIIVDKVDFSMHYIFESELYFNISISDASFENTDLKLMNGLDIYNVSSPMHGAITDVNIWNYTLSTEEISDWTNCKRIKLGNIIDWDTVVLDIQFLETIEYDIKDICKIESKKLYIGFNKNLVAFPKEHLNFCKSLGFRVAVPSNDNEFQKLIKTNTELGNNCSLLFFSGYRKAMQGYVNINNNKLMVWNNKFHHDMGYCITVYDNELFPDGCGSDYCPICETEKIHTKFQLRGLCFESNIDTFYSFVNSTYLIGYINSEMIYNSDKIQWEIRNTRTGNVSAVMNDTLEFPIGIKKWYLIGSSCKDKEAAKSYRLLKLYLDVTEPGHFCCDDGICINSKFVCDNFGHCSNSEDERNCTLISKPPDLSTDLPPVEITDDIDDSWKITSVNVSVTIHEIFSVHQSAGTFEILFSVDFKWKDHNLKYFHLKDGLKRNSYERNQTWTPSVKIFHTKKDYFSDFESYVEKNVSNLPILSHDIESINPKEMYKGSDHFLHLNITKRTEFLCSFSQIAEYPFEKEECSFQVSLRGRDEDLTILLIEENSFEVPNEMSVAEYSINEWTIEKDCSTKAIRIKMVLERKFFCIFMITFLPTILMNIINQASNHINGDSKFDMIITVNITSMMVLASIYVSVSSSLPSTPTIKPVEWWLLFNLSYPFLVIITNIVVQV